jgi:hypothetical protein
MAGKTMTRTKCHRFLIGYEIAQRPNPGSELRRAKDLNREAKLKTLLGVGSTVPVGRVTFFNEALRQFLKAFNDKILPSVVTKR